jgi:hypothetical protein
MTRVRLSVTLAGYCTALIKWKGGQGLGEFGVLLLQERALKEMREGAPRQGVGLGESWSARSDHPPVEHLPHTHGPTQFGSFVKNVVTRHNRQCLDTRLSQQCCTSHSPFDITGPDPPGDLHHEVDLSTILTPLAPHHDIGPANLIGAFLRKRASGHCLCEQGGQLIAREHLGPLHQAREV